MRNWREIFMVLTALLGCSATVRAQEVEGTLSMDVVSAYVWRAQHNATASLQPSLGIGYGGLSVGAWGSFALSPEDAYQGTQEEIDLTGGYEVKEKFRNVEKTVVFESVVVLDEEWVLVGKIEIDECLAV